MFKDSDHIGGPFHLGYVRYQHNLSVRKARAPNPYFLEGTQPCPAQLCRDLCVLSTSEELVYFDPTSSCCLCFKKGKNRDFDRND